MRLHNRSQCWKPPVAPLLITGLLLIILTLAPAIDTAFAATDETPLTGPITEPRQLLLSESPYRVDGELQISAIVKIEPGVEIIFGSGASINIVENGAIDRLYAGSATTLFRGAAQTPGWWGGIVAQYESRALLLTNCDISDATVAVTSETKSLWLRSCTLHNNKVGLALTANGVADQRLEDIVIANNTDYALRYFMSQNVETTGIDMVPPFKNLTVSGNGMDAVQIDPSLTFFGWQIPNSPAELKLTSPETANGDRLPLDTPYVALNALQTLRVEAGTILRIPGVRAYSDSALLVEGLPAQPVRFEPHPHAPDASWDGIALTAGSTALIDHCDISGVGTGPGLSIDTDATVNYCAIHDGKGNGLQLSQAGISPILNGITIADNAGDAISQATANMQPHFSELAVSGNGRDALVIHSGQIFDEVTLDSMITISDTALPIFGGLDVQDGGYLRILPGTEIYMGSDERLAVRAGGTLSATGVLLSGQNPQPGSWRGVDLNEGSSALIEECTVGYGGVANSLNAVVTIASSDVTLRNCTIHGGPNHGIQLMGDGLTPRLENLVIEDNAGAAVSEWNKQGATMNPVYSGLEASGNGQNGILLDVRNFYSDTHLEMPGSTNGEPLPYLVPALLSVGVSSTLTIAEGVVMEFTDSRNWGYLAVNGRLMAKDAIFRGREETPGSWAGVRILQGGSVQMRGCQILFAGDTSNNSRWRGVALRIETTELVSLNYCTIRGSAGLAVNVAGGAQVDLRSNNIHNNQQGGIASTATASGLARAPRQTASPVDARDSWWGDASGPANLPDNPDGQGDRVTGSVLFTPWAKQPVVEPLFDTFLYLPAVSRGP